MATAGSAASTVSESSSDGPVLSLMNKRLRALRKKQNRIAQMEDAVAQGKTLNREQEDVLRSKPAVLALIDEYEKLRAPLAAALHEEIAARLPQRDDLSLEDLLGLLYFSRLFDVQPQSEFTATMLTRTHERSCCLTYDYVTDDAVDLLREGDLDEISVVGSLVTSRPVSAGVSHKNALRGCVEHAKLWLEQSDQPIKPGASVTYAVLREKLKKIMASDYYTTTPEMKAPDDVAAAAGMYSNVCQVQVPEPVTDTVPEVQIDVAPETYQYKEVAQGDFQETEVTPNQSNPVDESPNDEADVLNPLVDVVTDQPEQQKSEADEEQFLRDVEQKDQQYVPRRAYQNQRGGNRGGGGYGVRRGYSNGRGSRGGRAVGGAYQNGRSQYYDPGYNPRNNYNTRGRGGGRSGGSFMPNNFGTETYGGPVPVNAE